MGREGGGLEAIGVGGACGRPDVETATVRRPVGGLLRGGAAEALGRAGKLASVIGGEDLAGGPWGLSGGGGTPALVQYLTSSKLLYALAWPCVTWSARASP